MSTAPARPDTAASANRVACTRLQPTGVDSLASTSGSPVNATATHTPAPITISWASQFTTVSVCVRDHTPDTMMPAAATAIPQATGIVSNPMPMRLACARIIPAMPSLLEVRSSTAVPYRPSPDR